MSSNGIHCSTCHCFLPAVPLTNAHWNRLESLLRENTPLSAAEKKTFSELERNIEGYGQEIIRLKSEIVSLQHRRNELERYVSLHKSLSAPVRKLPNELLIEVFKRACMDRGLGCDAFSPSALQLAAVCRYWRFLVTSEPRLWSTLGNIDLSRLTDRDRLFTVQHSLQRRILSLLPIFLERSKDYPLSFDFDRSLTSVGEHDIHIARLLAGESSRWFSVSLINFPLDLLRSGLPNLQSLEISGHPDISSVPAMPSLRSLSIGGQWELDRTLFPWAQLMHLDLYGRGCASGVSVLPLCTQLTSLKLRDIRTVHMVPPFSSSLSSLTIIDVAKVMAAFFESATLPRLTSLNILYIYELSDFPVVKFMSFLSRSQCSITTFHLSSPCITTSEVIAILNLLPTVTSLYLCEYADFNYDNFIEHLKPFRVQTSAVLLPKLIHFELSSETDGDFDFLLFVEVIQSRWNPMCLGDTRVASLKSVELRLFNLTLDQALLPPLVELQRAGLTVTIQDSSGLVL